MPKYKIGYSTPWCGCDDEDEQIFKSLEEAEQYAQDWAAEIASEITGYAEELQEEEELVSECPDCGFRDWFYEETDISHWWECGNCGSITHDCPDRG